MSRINSTLSFTANAAGPNVWLNCSPWYPSDGDVNEGNLPLRVQSNLPVIKMSKLSEVKLQSSYQSR